jgi:hypothetical protein
MKVKLRRGILGYNGTSDDMIYYTLPNCKVIIGRSKPENFKAGKPQKAYRSNAAQIKTIQPVQAYKDDFKLYTALYIKLSPENSSISNWYNLFIKMLWNQQKAGICDIGNLTREVIYAQNLPCKSVKSAVEAGLLPAVLHWENYTAEI